MIHIKHSRSGANSLQKFGVQARVPEARVSRSVTILAPLDRGNRNNGGTLPLPFPLPPLPSPLSPYK